VAVASFADQIKVISHDLLLHMSALLNMLCWDIPIRLPTCYAKCFCWKTPLSHKNRCSCKLMTISTVTTCVMRTVYHESSSQQTFNCNANKQACFYAIQSSVSTNFHVSGILRVQALSYQSLVIIIKHAPLLTSSSDIQSDSMPTVQTCAPCMHIKSVAKHELKERLPGACSP